MNASCSFGNLSPGEQRSVSLTARGTLAGNFSAHARVSALNDRLASNNARDLVFNIRSGVDAAVTLTAEAPEVALGAPLQIYADIRSLRGLAVRDAVLSLNLNQAVIAASLAGRQLRAERALRGLYAHGIARGRITTPDRDDQHHRARPVVRGGHGQRRR